MPAFLQMFLTARGRLRRSTYWTTAIALTIVFAAFFVLLERAFGHTATLILYPPFLWSAFCLMSRRLHDSARSAWWLLVVVIPVIGPVWLFVLLGFVPGTRGDNQYGPDPRTANADYLTVKIGA